VVHGFTAHLLENIVDDHIEMLFSERCVDAVQQFSFAEGIIVQMVIEAPWTTDFEDFAALTSGQHHGKYKTNLFEDHSGDKLIYNGRFWTLYRRGNGRGSDAVNGFHQVVYLKEKKNK
jgi:hypothetical protein